jgi:NosR/NirI family transcriptional regulator, nitrous oxide reductase regulator
MARACLSGFAGIRAIVALVLLALQLPVGGIERFPPPDFQSGYALPVTGQSPAKSMPREYLDVAVLAGALALASWLALRRRSRSGLLVLSLFAVAYFGFWRKGCICPIGAIQNVTLGLFDATYAVPLFVLAFFLLPLVFALFFGRTYCAAVCPHGAIQDLVLVRPVRLPRGLEAALGLIPFLYLGLAVLFAATGSLFAICRYDPFVALFRLSGSREMLVFGGLFLIVGLFIGRPYCRFVCPLGALFKVCSLVSRRHATITPDQCIHCRLCEDECPFGAIKKPVPPELAKDRVLGKRKLALVLVLLPLLVASGAGLGVRVGPALAREDPTVQLAEQYALPTADPVMLDRIKAFKLTGQPEQSLQAQARHLREVFRTGGGLLGAGLGLVVGLTLLALSVRREQPDYVPDRGDCVSCGRCFLSCPREWVRRGKIGAAPNSGAAGGGVPASDRS